MAHDRPLPRWQDAKKDDEDATPGLETLQARVESLYEAIGQPDVAPTAAQVDAVHQTSAALNAALATWERFVPRVTAMNSRLRAAGLAEIDPERKPTSEAGHRNEE